MYLLDTHILIWFVDGDLRLKKPIRELILNDNNDIFISVASIWELSIKQSLGKIKLSYTLEELVDAINENSFQIVDVNTEMALKVKDLPNTHYDPFDRIIISAAIVKNLTIITHDKVFKEYPVKIRLT